MDIGQAAKLYARFLTRTSAVLNNSMKSIVRLFGFFSGRPALKTPSALGKVILSELLSAADIRVHKFSTSLFSVFVAQRTPFGAPMLRM